MKNRRSHTVHRVLATVIAATAIAVTGGCGDDQDEASEPEVLPEAPASEPSAESEPAEAPAEAEPEDAEPEDVTTAQSFPGIAGQAGVEWEDCNPTETTTDWVGNTFDWTLCWTPNGETVSFYEYDASDSAGMADEYVVGAHITDTWGVAADSTSMLDEIVANLEAAGYSRR